MFGPALVVHRLPPGRVDAGLDRHPLVSRELGPPARVSVTPDAAPPALCVTVSEWPCGPGGQVEREPPGEAMLAEPARFVGEQAPDPRS